MSEFNPEFWKCELHQAAGNTEGCIKCFKLQAVKEYQFNNGRKAGTSTLNRHGKEHFIRISKLAAESRKRNRDAKHDLQE